MERWIEKKLGLSAGWLRVFLFLAVVELGIAWWFDRYRDYVALIAILSILIMVGLTRPRKGQLYREQDIREGETMNKMKRFLWTFGVSLTIVLTASVFLPNSFYVVVFSSPFWVLLTYLYVD